MNFLFALADENQVSMRKPDYRAVLTLKHSGKSSAEKNRGGRPAKFSEPSRPVTVTLPERVLRLLAGVDSDRAKAISKLVVSLSAPRGKFPPPVATVEVAAGMAIILVNHSARLARLPWLRLIEVAPGRNLISIRSGTSIETIEVALRDLLEDLPAGKSRDREILDALLDILRASRRTNATLKEEILFVKANG